MLAIELAFPGNRYHANPWNRHVNEGLVEWPPSPWRILRALQGIWYLKARDGIEEQSLAEILDQLSVTLPRYRVPPSVAAHARYYYPAGDGGKPTKTFDAFLRLAPGASLRIEWPDLQVGGRQRDQLAVLLARMGYLGRAESLVEARLVATNASERDDRPVVVPRAEDSDALARESLELLAPLAPDALTHWRQGVIEQRMAHALQQARKKALRKKKDPERVSVSAREKRNIEDSVPASVFAALAIETATMHKQGWNRPPGSRWVTYTSEQALTTVRPARRRRPARSKPLTVARLAVTSKLAPQLTDALVVTEKLRQRLIKRSDGASVFSGHDDAQRPNLGHSHMFMLPEANSTTGRITHITLYASAGFRDSERDAIAKIGRLFLKDGAMTVVLLDFGDVATFAGMDTKAGQCPLLATSQTWFSHTPFVATRHPKAYREGRPKLDDSGVQIGSPEHDLRRLLPLRDNGDPVSVRIQRLPEADVAGKPVQWHRFRTRRQSGHGARGSATPCGFRLEFSSPQTGPIALGYGAHFGLGVFKAQQ